MRSSSWFVPSVMTLLAITLSFVTITIDDGMNAKTVGRIGWIWAGGPEGARELLSTIAGSMITVAGVTFSITIVALSLTSSQFGPRVLRNFMRDPGNQIVLGTFVATFVIEGHEERVVRLTSRSTMMTLRVYGWVDQRRFEFLKVRSEAIRLVKEAFEAAGAVMPEPTYTIAVRDAGAPRQGAASHPKAGPNQAIDIDRRTEIERQIAEERRRTDEPDLLRPRSTRMMIAAHGEIKLF